MQFLSSELPCEPKSLDVALNTADVDRIRSEKRAVAVNVEGHSIRILNERKRFSNQYQRHLIPAMQLAVSCSELYFARCCALRRTDIFQIN